MYPVLLSNIHTYYLVSTYIVSQMLLTAFSLSSSPTKSISHVGTYAEVLRQLTNPFPKFYSRQKSIILIRFLTTIAFVSLSF